MVLAVEIFIELRNIEGIQDKRVWMKIEKFIKYRVVSSLD